MNHHPPKFLHLDRKQIEYAWYGPPPDQATTLVFLHEGLGCTSMWRDFPERVANAAGCAALVYSRFGYGCSSPCTLPRPLRYMREEALSVLPRLLDALQIKDFILIGHSDGGSIALIYAGGADHAEAGLRLRGVITEAAHIFCEEISVDSIRALRQPYQEREMRQKMMKHHGDNVDIAFWGWNDAWLLPEFRQWNIEEYLPKIKVPLLVLQGCEDQYGTPAQVEAIAAQSGGTVEVRLIPECAHNPHREQEAVTLSAMKAFIKQIV